jgi:hypothetical protein
MATQEPQPVTIDVAPAGKTYLEALEEYGMLQGEHGNQTVHDEAVECLTALHHALGGGQVRVEIVQPGADSVVSHLETTLQAALAETNTMRGLGIQLFFY